jgi:sulfite reductase (NADPH) flavoprotein alpha-component
MNYNRKNPYQATLKDRWLLNSPESTKSTYHIVLEVDKDSLPYKVGDSVGIYPTNTLEDATKIYNLVDCEEKDQQFLEELQENYSINFATKKLLELLKNSLPEGEKKQELVQLLDTKDIYMKYLEEKELQDVLSNFPVKLTKEEFLKSLKPLLPRFYSISSSPIATPDEIHLTVTELSYSVNGVIRYGIGSRFLCNLTAKDQKIKLYVQPTTHFTLPENDSLPIIMIGPGTGVAPFRAFLQERWHRKATGKNWLFFGERHKDSDFYYQDFFKKLEKENFLKLDLAFSRDGSQKVYVQHKLFESAQEIYQWINQGALVYVCGDAKSMAKEVEAAFLTIFETYGHLTSDEARTFLKELRKSKRYLTDVY